MVGYPQIAAAYMCVSLFQCLETPTQVEQVTVWKRRSSTVVIVLPICVYWNLASQGMKNFAYLSRFAKSAVEAKASWILGHSHNFKVQFYLYPSLHALHTRGEWRIYVAYGEFRRGGLLEYQLDMLWISSMQQWGIMRSERDRKLYLFQYLCNQQNLDGVSQWF